MLVIWKRWTWWETAFHFDGFHYSFGPFRWVKLHKYVR